MMLLLLYPYASYPKFYLIEVNDTGKDSSYDDYASDVPSPSDKKNATPIADTPEEEDKKMKGLMLSAIVAKSSEVAEKIVCEPKSLENWKKINQVETKKESKKKKSSCVDVKEPEAKSISKTVLKEK